MFRGNITYILIGLFCGYTVSQSYPTILIHGILSNSGQLNTLADYISTPTYSIEIGDGAISSITKSMNQQCKILSEKISNLYLNSKLINMIGVSQGGLLARCYIEKYSHNIIPVNTLITLGTPHMGIYLSVLNALSIKDYTKDPFHYQEYLSTNQFLSLLNNERPHPQSEQYKQAIINLHNFVVIWSNIDDVIKPVESSCLEYYDILKAQKDDKLVIQPFKSSDTYVLDLIGLGTLYNNRKLSIYRVECEHSKLKLPECFNNIYDSTHNQTLIDTINGYLE